MNTSPITPEFPDFPLNNSDTDTDILLEKKDELKKEIISAPKEDRKELQEELKDIISRLREKKQEDNLEIETTEPETEPSYESSLVLRAPTQISVEPEIESSTENPLNQVDSEGTTDFMSNLLNPVKSDIKKRSNKKRSTKKTRTTKKSSAKKSSAKSFY